jgi:hypothetical protein
MNSPVSALDWLAVSMLPQGNGSVVAFANVYFDESGTHADSRVIAMAGYWFDADQARKFSRDWQKELKRFGISAAHQTDCALGYGQFRNMSKEQRVDVQKALILHIKRRSKFSVAVALGRSLYEKVFSDVPGAPSAYTFLLLLCVNKIAEEMEFRKWDGKVAYFFEAGHADANEANKFMNFMAEQTRLGAAKHFHYSGHAFVDKSGALPLQAADMLVWHVRHFFERKLDGHEKPRKDYVALTRRYDLITVIEPAHLLALRQLYANANTIFGEALTDPHAKIPGFEVAEGIARSFGLNLNQAREVRAWLEKQQSC